PCRSRLRLCAAASRVRIHQAHGGARSDQAQRRCGGRRRDAEAAVRLSGGGIGRAAAPRRFAANPRSRNWTERSLLGREGRSIMADPGGPIMFSKIYTLGRILVPILFVVSGIRKLLDIDAVTTMLAEHRLPIPERIPPMIMGLPRMDVLAYLIGG